VAERYDVIELGVKEPSGPDDDLDYPVVTVALNGIDLRHLVLTAMRQVHPEVAFAEPSDSELLNIHAVAAPSLHWRGAPVSDLAVDGHAAVLTCSCTAFGCGGTAARIDIAEDRVTWSDFIDPWGGSLPVGTFRFDRSQYYSAIERLPKPE
jgi:hypothetical protein